MHSVWHDMFSLGLPVAEKILRPLVVYMFLVVGLRLAGKRELAQLNTFDLILLLTISNTVQNAIIGDDNSVAGGVIGATTLLLVNYLVARYLYAHEKLDRIVEGESDVLIENGRLREDRLKEELMTRTELETAAHRQGFASLAEIERAVIDPGGAGYFVPKKPTVDERQQSEITTRLDEISNQLEMIRSRLA